MLIGLRGDLGLDSAITEAHRGIRVTAGLNDEPSNHCGSAPAIPLVHPDLPHWFRSNEQLLHLRLSAEALRQGQHVELRYRRDANVGEAPAHAVTRNVAPLGLVNRAGIWYLVAIREQLRVVARGILDGYGVSYIRGS